MFIPKCVKFSDNGILYASEVCTSEDMLNWLHAFHVFCTHWHRGQDCKFYRNIHLCEIYLKRWFNEDAYPSCMVRQLSPTETDIYNDLIRIYGTNRKGIE